MRYFNFWPRFYIVVLGMSFFFFRQFIFSHFYLNFYSLFLLNFYFFFLFGHFPPSIKRTCDFPPFFFSFFSTLSIIFKFFFNSFSFLFQFFSYSIVVTSWISSRFVLFWRKMLKIPREITRVFVNSHAPSENLWPLFVCFMQLQSTTKRNTGRALY